MGNFRQNNKFGGRGGRGGGGGFSDRNSGRPAMHEAVCSECGKDCEVPFKPSGGKPVFCNDCFSGRRNSEPRGVGGEQRGFGGKDSGRFNSGDKRMHEAVCDKCGKDCEVPFRPTGNKPVYCSQCFGKADKYKGPDKEGRQFEIINAKLDKILKALNPAVSAEAGEKKITIKKKEITKPKEIGKGKVKKVASPKRAKTKKKK